MGTAAGAYLALFVIVFAIAEVIAESLGGQFTATGAPRWLVHVPRFLNYIQSAGVLQIIVALISAGTGAALVKL
jgi:hypothetical protein